MIKLLNKLRWLFHPLKLERLLRYRHMVNSPSWSAYMMAQKKDALDKAWKLSYGKGKGINWINPKTFNEKIQWLEAFTDTSLWTEYSDKIKVRQHIKDMGFEDILIPLYGSWEKFEDIDFGKLPDSFVLKCNHDCGSTVIVHDKSKIDKKKLKHFFDMRVNTPMGIYSVEPHYVPIERRIMAEKLLTPPTDGSSENKEEKRNTSGLTDYKFQCINGEPIFCFVGYDRVVGESVVYDTYDINPWKPCRDYLSDKFKKLRLHVVTEPKNLDKMIQIAKVLSKGFPQVRIDLYNINGKIYFSEMTFTSDGGRIDFYSDAIQLRLGGMLELPRQ